MYLIRNKRTKDFIDNTGDWTMIRSFAKKFTSKDEAQKFIDKHQTKNDEPYMEIVSESIQKHLKEYLAEATMSDIPHEIDDQIHKLKDMRFELEETEKNWKLAGLDTKPLLDVITSINNLIENMYSNGAKLADQEVIKESATPKLLDELRSEIKLLPKTVIKRHSNKGFYVETDCKRDYDGTYEVTDKMAYELNGLCTSWNRRNPSNKIDWEMWDTHRPEIQIYFK